VKFKHTLSGFALAAAFAIGTAAAQAAPAEVVTNGPQVNPGDTAGWSAHQNVIESEQYDRLVATNPRFRAYRIRKECGPIADPQLHEECIASFNTYEGSSMPGRRY
jgi:hypothetical protein